ncbi:MAG: hypothetical protein HY749_20555 [Gammaproteobacteria bacterium]|nr:hypothetical protein [Gammaproteobacteria bacterium]MBI5616763.1 hypothetical protein [Gammaproteobacteria bacterium]
MYRQSRGPGASFGWRLALCAAAAGIAVIDVLSHAQKRSEERHDVDEQVKNWENEGGAAPPEAAAAEAANEPL